MLDIQTVQCFSIGCKPDFSYQLLNCDFYSISGMSDFFNPFLCDQLFVLFNQLYMCLFRSVVFDIRSVVCFIYLISCTCDFFDQL